MHNLDPPVDAFRYATVILLNGPPRCGKDTAAEHLHRLIERSVALKFAEALKRSVHVDFGLPLYTAVDAFEDCKDEPQEAFFGQTPRQAYIQKSELRQKPFLGDDIYGRLILRRMWDVYQLKDYRVFLMSDSGFAAESQAVIAHLGAANVMLVRIHAEGRGCSFAGDSRSYLELPDVYTYDINNNAGKADFLDELGKIVKPFVFARTRIIQPSF